MNGDEPEGGDAPGEKLADIVISLSFGGCRLQFLDDLKFV
jgi:hypothetical protein